MESKRAEIARYFFKQDAFWENIPQPVYDALKAHSTITKVKKGEMIYSEGTYPKGLYIIAKGIAKLYVMNNMGKEQIIYMLSKNEMFGYRSIVCNNNSVIFITAITECEIELIDREVFLYHLFNSIELNKVFMNYFGEEFRILYNKISFFSLKPVEERVALTLLVLDQKFNDHSNEHTLSISRTDLANYAGITIETFSRQLRKLKDRKAVITNGRKITLINFEALFKIANI